MGGIHWSLCHYNVTSLKKLLAKMHNKATTNKQLSFQDRLPFGEKNTHCVYTILGMLYVAGIIDAHGGTVNTKLFHRSGLTS